MIKSGVCGVRTAATSSVHGSLWASVKGRTARSSVGAKAFPSRELAEFEQAARGVRGAARCDQRPHVEYEPARRSLGIYFIT